MSTAAPGTPRVAPGCRRDVGLPAWGVSRAAGVATGPGARGWADRERVVLETVDALHDAADLDDRQWARLRAHLDEREAIELCTLAAHYEMLATMITAPRIQPDRPTPGRVVRPRRRGGPGA